MADKHIADAEDTFFIKNVTPDFCRVGDDIIPFNIMQVLTPEMVRYSTSVFARGNKVLLLDSINRGVIGNAGAGVKSGVSQSNGHTKVVQGSKSVYIEGRSVTRHGDLVLMNMRMPDETDNGTWGRIYTWTGQASDEATRVVKKKWEEFKGAIKTLGTATGIGVSAEQASAARAEIGQVVTSLATLAGPSPEDMQGAYLNAAITGDTSAIDAVQAAQSAQQTAVAGIVQNVKQAWNEAKARNGPVGAVTMVATTVVTEIVGQKGIGAAGHVAADVAEGAKLASEAAKAAKVADAAERGAQAAEEAKAAAKAGKDGVYVVKWSVPQKVRDKIPESWGEGKPNSKGEGTKWNDPNSPKANMVRVDKGNPANSQPTQQVDHVVVISGGRVIGRNGLPISGSIEQNFESAHIPLSEYENWATWNSPK